MMPITAWGSLFSASVPTDDGRICVESRPPEAFADHDNVGRTWLVLAGPEGTTRERRDAHGAENAGRHHGSRQALRLIAAREVDGNRAIDTQMLEDLVLLEPVVERRPRDGHVLTRTVSLVQDDEPLHVRVGEWSQHHGVGHREDGGIRADSQRERGDDDGGDDRGPPQRANGIEEVLPERGHEGAPS